MGALLIVNPWASRVTPEVVAAVERELEAAGPLETVLTRHPGHATELAAEAAGRSERIYVLSGDGVFNEVLNGLDDEVAVGFIPGGGTSVLPRALGLPRDPVAGARALARSETERRLSLGRVEGRVDGALVVDRRFAFAAGLGVDAALVRAVDARGRRGGKRPGDLAFAAEAVRLLASRRGRLAPQLTVSVAAAPRSRSSPTPTRTRTRAASRSTPLRARASRAASTWPRPSRWGRSGCR